MKDEWLKFRESLVQLAGIYGVGGISHEINRVGFEKRLATKAEKEKEYIFDIKKEITEEEEIKSTGAKSYPGGLQTLQRLFSLQFYL